MVGWKEWQDVVGTQGVEVMERGGLDIVAGVEHVYWGVALRVVDVLLVIGGWWDEKRSAERGLEMVFGGGE